MNNMYIKQFVHRNLSMALEQLPINENVRTKRQFA